MAFKLKAVLATGLVATLMLAGCGDSGSFKNDVSVSKDDKAQNIENPKEQEASAEASSVESAPVEESPKPEETITYTDEIYGNGSYFVKVGEKVFFHDYEKVTAKESSQGGQFLDLGGGIVCFDESDGTITRITSEPLTGELYLLGDRFFGTVIDSSGRGQIVSVTADAQTHPHGLGRIKGVSEDGKRIAIWNDNDSGQSLEVLTDELLGDVNQQFCIVDKPEDGTIAYCGLTDESLIYTKKSGDKIDLFSMGSDSQEVCLGTLSDMGIYGGLECDDFLYDEGSNMVYAVFAHYGGPVDSVEDYLIVSAAPGQEGSATLIQHGYDYNVMPNLTSTDEPTLRLIDGKLSYGFYDEKELYLSHSYLGSHMLSRFVYGNLLWCDEEGNVQNIVKSFIPYMDRDNFVMQTGQVLGDEAFVLVAGVVRNEASDVKLSQAFDFGNMYVLRVPLKENSTPETIVGGDFEELISFDREGFEPYVGTWRLDEFTNVASNQPYHSPNMWIGITEDQELRFIDYEEYSGFPFMLSTSSIGNDCLIVGYSEGLGLTLTGKLVVNETDGSEALLLEVQEKLESIDDIRPASWQGSFHRVTDEEMKTEWG